jgi:hypothetical protein
MPSLFTLFVIWFGWLGIAFVLYTSSEGFAAVYGHDEYTRYIYQLQQDLLSYFLAVERILKTRTRACCLQTG